MWALVKTKPEKSYDYSEIPRPKPVANEVLIKVEKVAICGSDINLYHWNDTAKQIASLPFTPGHEVMGVVRID